jgi:hypothetical protein
MVAIQTTISDAEIMYKIEENNLQGWADLYEKYGLIMFVAIFWATDDEKTAEELLVSLFKQLKQNPDLLRIKTSLPISLLYHTYVTVMKIIYVNKNAIAYRTPLKKVIPMLHLVSFKPNSIHEISEILEVSADEVQMQLHRELNEFRNK